MSDKSWSMTYKKNKLSHHLGSSGDQLPASVFMSSLSDGQMSRNGAVSLCVYARESIRRVSLTLDGVGDRRRWIQIQERLGSTYSWDHGYRDGLRERIHKRIPQEFKLTYFKAANKNFWLYNTGTPQEDGEQRRIDVLVSWYFKGFRWELSHEILLF